MSSFAANFTTRSLIGNRCRFRLFPWMVKTRVICCSSGGGKGPVRYIPKKNLKPQAPQNPPGFENHARNSALRLEGANGWRSSGMSPVLNNKSQIRNERTHHANKEVEEVIDHCEGNAKYEYLEGAKEVVAEPGIRQGNEDAPGPEKNLQAEVPRRGRPYVPCPGPVDHVRNNFADENALRLEGPSGRKSSDRSPVLNEKSQIRKEIPYYDNKEVEEKIYHCEEAAKYEYLEGANEVVDEPRIRQGKMTSENLQAEVPRRTPYVPSPSPVNHVRNFADISALRLESPSGRKSLDRGPVLNEKTEIRNEIPYYDDEEMEEEFDDCLKASETECLERAKEVVEESRPRNKDAPEAGKTMQDAEKVAIGLLAKRAYTAAELKKKLLKRNFSIDISDAVIVDFHSRGLISDRLYAEMYSRSRWSSSSWGPRRIKQGLFQKGVSGVEAQKALKLVFEENDSAHDEGSNLDLSKAIMDRLYVQASKQWLRGPDVPDETRKSRIIRWLQYRGFDWGVVKVILKKLESEHRS